MDSRRIRLRAAVTLVLTAALLLSCCGLALAGEAADDPKTSEDRSGGGSARYSGSYAESLFDSSRVHTIDIRTSRWEWLKNHALEETYIPCQVEVDGTLVRNVGIRAKGNTSLATVALMDTERFSLKIEFDKFIRGQLYQGLDKLNLNNLMQDATLMKEMLSFEMMRRMGVSAPLCSYVRVSVNGSPLGLYLGVEGIDTSFLNRVGWFTGRIYKPDVNINALNSGTLPMLGSPAGEPDMAGIFEGGLLDANAIAFGRVENVMGFGDDLKLKYLGESPRLYPNLIYQTRSRLGRADITRLIHALRNLSSGEHREEAMDPDEIMRFLAVHSFLGNDDSYTGQMPHNYYLCEEAGRLHMIPWDYNLAFGGMVEREMAQELINASIDALVTGEDPAERPLIGWIAENEESREDYHAVWRRMIAEVVDSGWLEEKIRQIREMILPEAWEDPTRFFDMERIEQAQETLARYCLARAESVHRQLDGMEETVDAEDISLYIMGGIMETQAQMQTRTMEFLELTHPLPTNPTDLLMIAGLCVLLLGAGIALVLLCRDHNG